MQYAETLRAVKQQFSVETFQCRVSCVHTVANCPFAMRHTGLGPNMGWIMILYNTIVLLIKKVRLRQLAYNALV